MITAVLFILINACQQALTDALVQDWQDHTELFACMMDEWREERFSFKGLYTLNGLAVNGTWNKGKFRTELHPNGAKEIDIRISEGQTMIRASGQKDGPNTFNPGEIITFTFKDNQPVILSNR